MEEHPELRKGCEQKAREHSRFSDSQCVLGGAGVCVISAATGRCPWTFLGRANNSYSGADVLTLPTLLKHPPADTVFPTRWYQYAKALECYIRASSLAWNIFPLLLNN